MAKTKTPQKTEDQIINAVGKNFRCFGGKKVTWGNPIAEALQDAPYVFAAGVNVRDVVRFVTAELGLQKAKPVKRKAPTTRDLQKALEAYHGSDLDRLTRAELCQALIEEMRKELVNLR